MSLFQEGRRIGVPRLDAVLYGAAAVAVAAIAAQALETRAMLRAYRRTQQAYERTQRSYEQTYGLYKVMVDHVITSHQSGEPGNSGADGS